MSRFNRDRLKIVLLLLVLLNNTFASANMLCMMEGDESSMQERMQSGMMMDHSAHKSSVRGIGDQTTTEIGALGSSLNSGLFESSSTECSCTDCACQTTCAHFILLIENRETLVLYQLDTHLPRTLQLSFLSLTDPIYRPPILS